MGFLKYTIALLFIIGLFGCTSGEDVPEVAKVEMKQNAQGNYRLFVDGKEFYVNGAGLEFGNIVSLAEHGGNSFRTWRTENGRQDALEVLDKAHKNGLKVLMGLEVGRERHGFDYNDSSAVKKQLDYLKGEVERLKQHPALLAWSIGNELNLGANNLKVYDAVNDISTMIHEVDPNHPTTTTFAGLGKREIDYVKEHCTDLDFISIQLYGAIERLEQFLTDAGWDGPYLVTEWGATGHWEVERTDWDVAIEPTSQEKANSFINRYRMAIQADSVNCMGSYVFLWGQKQERTPTWYGVFLENGNKTESVDAMQFLWTGNWPENRCPTIDSVKINNLTSKDNVRLKTSEQFSAEVFARDYENDSLEITWEIIPESTDLGWGGDFEERPETYMKTSGHRTIELPVPNEEGAHRIFVYVTDPHGQSATANIPFLVTNE